MPLSGSNGFQDRLAGAARAVDERLAYWLDQAAAAVPSRLLAGMRHGLMAGGKRFRPFLVIEMARLLGGQSAVEAALDPAAALECVHAYSLVHDDLPAMDNDELRRGQPTVWKAYDEWTAILVGDALLTLAFDILSRSAGSSPADLDPARAMALVGRLAAAAGGAGMVGGQMLDLEAEKLGEPRAPTVSHIRRLQAMKTGALISYACEAGAIVAGAAPAGLTAARAYGDAIGLAFQISDDLLDATGDVATVGKAVGKDLALGKATLVGIEGIEAARRHLQSAVARAIASLEPFGAAARPLREAAEFQLTREH